MRRRLLRLTYVAAPVLVLAIAIGMTSERTSVRFDATGLKSVRYGSTEFLAAGDLHVNSVAFDVPGDTTTLGDLTAVTTIDRAKQQITQRFGWGTVAAIYRAHADRVDVTIVVTNSSARSLAGISIEPLSVKLPSPPREDDGATPMLAFDPGTPGILSLSFASGTLVLVHEDLDKPLLFGFPWASNRPTNTIYPMRVHTLTDPSYSPLYGQIKRPIAPGAIDSYHLSLRFGGRGSTTTQLAQDISAKFTTLFARQLHWTDKRPIGQLVLATSNAGWPTNPRGWLLDPTINVSTVAGVADFRSRILAWADQSVIILKDMNAQGMIAWDIEGEQFPHPTTYLCDPRVMRDTAPEMDGVADEFFKRFRDAGLRVGVCVRPQNLVMGSTNNPSQTAVFDPTQLLIDKIAYAKARWGASLFYIDSNGDPNLPIDAGIFQRVLAAHPDVLLIPEHENLRYYAYTAPYREMRQKQVDTPAVARLLYPGAFGVTYVADGDFAVYGEALKRSLQQGDSVMTRGWFADPANALIKTMRQ